MNTARAAQGALVLVLAVGSGQPARADTYVLTGGDRITGKTLLKAAKTFRVQTPYGRLVIPRDKVERILYDERPLVHPLHFEGMAERTVIAGSLSKEHRMIGWRALAIASTSASTLLGSPSGRAFNSGRPERLQSTCSSGILA